jgi:NAD(P)-dependent dehydrogenase (short-subunit alcohol dehydrogenase family)
VTADVESLIAEIETIGRRAITVPLDLSDTTMIEPAVSAAVQAMGRIDILVNNVGIAPGNAVGDVTERDFDATVAVNLKGTFFLSQAIGRHMISNGGGKIIFVSSQAGVVTLRGEAIYCMTKAAINHLARCMAVEWAPHGVRVNCVSPTFVWTDSTRPVLAKRDFYDRTVSHIPLGRIGETSEVSGAVVYLASDASSLVTGSNLMVDGGWSVA